MLIYSKLRNFIVLFILLLPSCDSFENPVPYNSVGVTLYNIESDPEYIKLISPYNAVELHDNFDCYGYNCNGILIYRLRANGEIDDFKAYDMTCPYEVSECVMEWHQENPYYATCSCCGSSFNLVGGYLEKGPSEYPPREIRCEFINGNLYLY